MVAYRRIQSNKIITNYLNLYLLLLKPFVALPSKKNSNISEQKKWNLFKHIYKKKSMCHVFLSI
jgi:hypothetical protein